MTTQQRKRKTTAGGGAARRKDPAGGLTAEGRRYFSEKEGAHLRPGVQGPADTPEKMRRKGSFLRRHYAHPRGPLQDERGEPTRLALQAHAWGEPVPRTMADVRRLAAKGTALLEQYRASKENADGAAEAAPAQRAARGRSTVKKAPSTHPATGHASTERSATEQAPAKKAPTKRSATERAPAKRAAASRTRTNAPKRPAAKTSQQRAKGGDRYTDPALRERLRKQFLAGDKGGAPGQWSARKAQLLASAYVKAGGGYRGGKSKEQRHLDSWTEEQWTTQDGDKAQRPGGTRRYLPKEAWEQLDAGERKATEEKKLAGSRRGKQFVANTQKAKQARRAAQR